MGLYDKYTVERLDDGDVVLVGEKHSGRGAERSRELAERVLDDVQPRTIAIEASAGKRPGSAGGMTIGHRYARDNGLPCLTIDTPKRFGETTDRVGELYRDANIFTHPIQEDGDLNPKAAHNARQAVYELYGKDTFYRMYLKRESKMAARLRRATERFSTPIVWFGGAFHVEYLAKKYRLQTHTEPVGGRRILDYRYEDPEQAEIYA